MRHSLLILAIAMTGCAQPNARLNTAPGSEFPDPVFDICDAHDVVMRCTKWRYGSGVVRPYDVPPATAERK